MPRRIIATLVRSAPIAAAALTAPCIAQWNRYDIDTAGTVGAYTSLALDSVGQPRVSYQDCSNYRLKFASMDVHGFWTTQVVDAPADGARVGRFTSICLDGQGLAHIAYQDQTNFDLKYARQLIGGGWDVLMLDAAGSNGHYPSICHNSFDGKVHIAYYDATNRDLKHASANSSGVGGWAFDRLDSGGDVGSYCSIAARGDGVMHISYYDATHGELKCAQKFAGVGWFWLAVDNPAQNVGMYTSITFDRDGWAQIAYYDLTNDRVKRATVRGMMGTLENVTSAGRGTRPCIACDADGVTHIAVYDPFIQGVQRYDDAGAGWGFEIVDDYATRWVGDWPSIKIRPNGLAIVSYHAGQKNTWVDGDLRVAFEP